MIELFKNKENCCGCSACMCICPQQAIRMKSDEEGFLYPQINDALCTVCGLCVKVCAFQNGYDTTENFGLPYVYAVKHKEEPVRMSSTSGGAFTAISDYILLHKGIVYGAAFDGNMNVVHQQARTKEERDKFKGSKYVQSDLQTVFLEIKRFLQEHKYVLFTGTPCQAAGLKSYLSDVNTERLYLCDIVCHGTPSPLMWREHIIYSENKQRSKIIEYYCRSKVKGWHGHNEMSIFKNGKKDHKSIFSQKHKKLFYAHLILRPACHNCKYTNFRRPSDITIADFWGIENCMPDFDDNKGISLMLINTPKGQVLFEQIRENLEYKQSNTKACLQPQLQHPSKPSPKREQFWRDYHLQGYSYVIKQYVIGGTRNKVKRLIKKTLEMTGMIEPARKICKRVMGGIQK